MNKTTVVFTAVWLLAVSAHCGVTYAGPADNLQPPSAGDPSLGSHKHDAPCKNPNVQAGLSVPDCAGVAHADGAGGAGASPPAAGDSAPAENGSTNSGGK